MKRFPLISLSLFMLLSSCATWIPEQYPSGRDITVSEAEEIQRWPGHTTERMPANWLDSCLSSVTQFFKPKTILAGTETLGPLPELTQLRSAEKFFPNKKKYIEYTANVDVMEKYPDYEDFLEQTAEILFEPIEPFGHINLRLGKKVYSFNSLEATSIETFSPEMRKSSNPKMLSSHGFVFQLGKEKIEALKKEVALFYNSSRSHNIPAFDAYSPLLKIEEREGVLGGKNLYYVTDSPKYGNDRMLKGKIVEHEGRMMLEAGSGLRVPVIKKGDTYYTQSYSCSSSATEVLEKYFGLKISYGYSAKSLAESLLKGNVNENISPAVVIKYYED